MTTKEAPKVFCERLHPILYVSDVVAATAFYTEKLGFTVGFNLADPPTLAGVNLGDAQIFLEQGTPNPNSCSVYFVIDDADELYEFQSANGVEIVIPPDDRIYGLRDYGVRDLYGYRLNFGHRLNVDYPALKIERVDVPVRLEKRLAALLQDLAEHKRMSLDSCLEEIILHTCDRLSLEEGLGALHRGEAVPSPHTRRTLDYIQELKQKHDIDYDSHASYRFTE